MIDGPFDIVDGGCERDLVELAVPRSGPDRRALRPFDNRVDGLIHRALVVAVVIDTGVVSVVVRREYPVFNEWPEPLGAE